MRIVVSMNFQGFVISDWQGLDRITSPPHLNYTYSVQAAIEAGIDMVSSFLIYICQIKLMMLSCNNIINGKLKSWRYWCILRLGALICVLQVMVPFNLTEFVNDLTYLVNSKVIPMDRIDDAVERILLVKFTMGLFENPLADFSLVHELGSQVS